MRPKDDKKIALIFSATLELVEQIGVAGITMRQIARKAKIATGTLYIYFKDKNELINALFRDCRSSSIKIYFEGYNADELFATSFKKVWKNIVRHRIENFEEAVFIEQCYHSPFISESSREMGHRVIKPLYELMERGIREKHIKKLDTFLLLTFMVGSMTEMIRYARYSGKQFSEQMIEETFCLCWQGMKN
jgi:AcrR family transcriptional regulator